MRRPSLDRMEVFLLVAESGGFSAAARRVGASKNALSQQVARLESELGVALFTRTTRKVVLTDAGVHLLQAGGPLLMDLRAAMDAAGGTAVEPSGLLRITAPADFSAAVLGPALAAFSRAHQNVSVELITGNEILDLVGERIDIAVRLGWLRDSSYQAVKVGEFSQLLIAAPVYLERAGMPPHPQRLVDHQWIEFSLLSQPLQWQFSGPDGELCSVRMTACARSNSPEGVLGLLRGGAGMSVMTDFSVESDLETGTLRHVLPDWRLPHGEIYLTWPGTRRMTARVRAFIDFFRDRLRANDTGSATPWR